MDILGQAVYDFYKEQKRGKLWIFDQFDQKTEMDTGIYFRKFSQMPEIEKKALELSKGKVLDIGAGAGSHSLYLQEKGLEVVALDISEKCCEIALERGVKKVASIDFFDLNTDEKFDTLLLLMNGIGICEDIFGFPIFLDRAKNLLNPGGQILFDSSDISYMYEEDEFPENRYYGEFICAYGYKKQKSDWFSWLYLDFDSMQKIASEKGWKVEKISEDDHFHYLAKLVLES
jgi:SAM-dependent methyltransferase